jgi:hypothetical protein
VEDGNTQATCHYLGSRMITGICRVVRLLVAGVTFESGSNMGPKLAPLLFGGGVGDQLLTRVGPYLKLQDRGDRGGGLQKDQRISQWLLLSAPNTILLPHG